MIYTETDVLTAAEARIDELLTAFDNVIVAFSGGKDSGVLLNLVVKRVRERGIDRRIVVMHQDFEAQYQHTTDYVDRRLAADLDVIEPFRLCLPMATRTACSMHETTWMPWDPAKKDMWVRPMPEGDGVVQEDAAPFFKSGMSQEETYAAFTPWLHRERGGRTVCLVGIRAQESLNRWRSVAKSREGNWGGREWTTRVEDDCYSAYPIYDWKTEDVWTANARFGWDYNKLYDAFHYAGVPLHAQRVASPFNDHATGSLHLYRAVEPATWARLVGRVNGVNFASIYGGTDAMAWKTAKLPKGHTWRSYVDFLLSTLPEATAASYRDKFATSIKFWAERGGCLSSETIDELRAMGVPLQVKGKTAYKSEKVAVTFGDYPDDADVKEFATVPSYKRMAICILKNDHTCKYMGFSQTKAETEKRRAAIAKYMAL